MRHLLVTGAAGFIGSCFVRLALKQNYRITILDALTYAGRRENLNDILSEGRCELIFGNICDFSLVDSLFLNHSFSAVINFAAESHVDNSITGPKAFIETNIFGTFNLLEVTRKHWTQWTEGQKKLFRFLHVSTDEVFGSLDFNSPKFSETSPYAPNSPYSASKASSDFLVRSWHHTYKIPTVTTNCSNNYGPRQFPEKLIPVLILNALSDKPLPIYGKGENIRDWIHVEDHCQGILLALEKGVPGETYCFGGNSERSNLQLAHAVCSILDELKPRADGKKHSTRIQFVTDRPGHDLRYAINDEKAQRQLGYHRKYIEFEQGLRQTVIWYLENQEWCKQVSL